MNLKHHAQHCSKMKHGNGGDVQIEVKRKTNPGTTNKKKKIDMGSNASVSVKCHSDTDCPKGFTAFNKNAM